MFAWRLEEGLTHSFVYDRRGEVLKNIFSDHPNWGGLRTTGSRADGGGSGGGGDDSADSVGFMGCCAWFNLLMEIEDHQPNAERVEGSIQLESITEVELYHEYVAAVSDSSAPAVHILGFSAWKAVWTAHYPQVAIVTVKNLLSKVLGSSCDVLYRSFFEFYSSTSFVSLGPRPPSSSRVRPWAGCAHSGGAPEGGVAPPGVPRDDPQ